VLAHIKKQKRRGQVLLDEELLETIACEAPEELGRADLRLAALENCLNKIRTEDRELLIHRYQSASGLEEFSERVGRSVSSLSVTLHRLRIALRKCIQNQIAPGGEPT
jgi:RNA polymerase sigma-70 factor (ECF subfamily)